jgi:predicted PurR-regulated permease PerM
VAGHTTAFVTNAVSSVLTFVILLVTMVVLFQEGPRVLELARRFLPLAERDKDAAIEQLQQVTRSVFFGVLLTALVQAVLGGIGTAVVGLPSPALFGAAMFFAALLPGGTALVWGPATVWLFATGHPWKGGVLLVWGLAVSSVDNLLRPLFIGRGARTHMLLVFFGIFGGMLAFGLVGLFIGPLVITSFLFLIDVARREFFPEEPPAVGGAGAAGAR